MKIGIPRERVPGERRVALVPDAAARLTKGGMEVVVEAGAGESAGFPDDLYAAAGVPVAPDTAGTVSSADVVLTVQPPGPETIANLREGSVLVGLLQPATSEELFTQLASRNVTALAMELVPRTTKAQSMDALSSQATVAGYKAVLVAASALGKLLPMLTTAAGTLAPAKVFVIGAGVAGLQAIATARRLGGIVSAFDVRSVVKEQVESLGASFVEAEAVSEGEGAGGYAKELAEEQQQKVLEAIGGHIQAMDVVITTAQIPGKRAPVLITAAMVESMRPGSVIVDLASESGGNCELTQAGETVIAHGVSIIGPRNLPATTPLHASQMYSKNLTTLVEYLAPEGSLRIDLDDPITGPMCVVANGQVRYGRTA
ncbi:MAG: Re/Si-specific NAD(P)(+) transhydrogenase subunit alpha [Gemmatimonadales bacterium]